MSGSRVPEPLLHPPVSPMAQPIPGIVYAWKDVALAAAKTAVTRARRMAMMSPLTHRLIFEVFERFHQEYRQGINQVFASLAQTEASLPESIDSAAFPTAWSAFLRKLDFENSHLSVLSGLASVDPESVVSQALQIKFEIFDESNNLFLKEAMLDLSERVCAQIISRTISSTEKLTTSTVQELLQRAMSAHRVCPSYADGWAKVIGIASIYHLDAVIFAFRKELSLFDAKSHFSPEAAGIFSMLTYIRVILKHSTEEVNNSRLSKVLEMHKTILLSKGLKQTVQPVALAQLIQLDISIRQSSAIFADNDTVEFLYKRTDAMSRVFDCKAAALKLMATILERSHSDFYEKNFDTFINKRILRHLTTPRKTAHCLRILLRVLTGAYQSPVNLDDMDGNVPGSIIVHPNGSEPHFHPYSFSIRRCPNSSPVVEVLQKFSRAVINKKVIHLSWPRYQYELSEIIMQFAVHDIEWTLQNVIAPLLAYKKGSHPELLLALTVCRQIFADNGDFQKHVHIPDSRKLAVLHMIRTMTSTIESILSKSFFEVSAFSSSERSQEPLAVTCFATISSSAFAQLGGVNAQSCEADAYFSSEGIEADETQEGDTDDSFDGRDFDYSVSPANRPPNPTSTYTLRLGSNDFPFLEGYAGTITNDAPGNHPSSEFSPNRRISSSGRAFRQSEGETTFTANANLSDNDQKRIYLRTKTFFIPIAAIRCLGALPSEATIVDNQSSVFLLPVLLHSYTPLAMAVSHSIQEMCAHNDSAWFITINESLLKFLCELQLSDTCSIVTVISQLAVNIETWSASYSKKSNELSPSLRNSLQTMDAVAAAYLSHEQTRVRCSAYHLLHIVWSAVRKFESPTAICFASFLSDFGSALVVSAETQLSEYHKSRFPGGISSDLDKTLRKEGSSSPGFFKDVIFQDAQYSEYMSFCLINLTQKIAEADIGSSLLDKVQGILSDRLNSCLNPLSLHPSGVKLAVAQFLSIRPKSELLANDVFLSLWRFFLLENKDPATQEAFELSLTCAHPDHLALLIMTLNQARNMMRSKTTSVAVKRPKKKESEFEDTLFALDRLWSRFLVALSEPKRLRQAFSSSPRVRSVFLESCRCGMTKSVKKWAETPSNLGDRADFLSNVCFALRRRHKYDGADFSGPFLETEIPEWLQEDRCRTLREVRIWSECGDVFSTKSEEMSSYLKTKWSILIEKQVQHSLGTNGKTLNEREKAFLTIELQSKMKEQMPVALADLRLRSFWCASRILSLGPVLDDASLAEGGWLDWALLAESNGVPALQMLVCFHWREMSKLLDRLYWETSEGGPLAQNLFIACASQLVPVCFGLSAVMTRDELQDCIPLSQDDIALQNLKRPLIHDMLAPLLVCSIFHMGSRSRPVSQTAAAMLARICDTLVTRSLNKEQAKSLAVLKSHHPGLQSQIPSIRCKNALIIARTVANLCSQELIALILNEVVLRWAQFHNRQWQQKQWFIDAFESFFLSLPFHKFAAMLSSDAAQLMLSDMVNVTRSLVRDSAPALQSMLNVWQSFAGARSEDHRNANIHAITEFILEDQMHVSQSDYLDAASLIAVELYRYSALSVLDCLLQRFEVLDVSLQAQTDPVSGLRVPSFLLSSVLGSRFQSCRPRLPAILQHIFLWLNVPLSPCVMILHDLLHYTNVLSIPQSDSGSPSLTGLIQPIPPLDKVTFQWMGTHCQEWDVTDDERILEVFSRIATCTSAISDANFVVPLEFVCHVVHRWTSRAFGAVITQEWASLMFYTASHSPRIDLTLSALRVLGILSVPDGLSSYQALAMILTSAVSRIEQSKRTRSMDEAVAEQVLRIYINTLASGNTLPWTYDRFRMFSSIFYQCAMLLRWPISVQLHCLALSCIKRLLKHPGMAEVLQGFPAEHAPCKDSSKVGNKPLERMCEGFISVGLSLIQFGYRGLQPAIIDGIISHPDNEEVMSESLSLLCLLWSIPCHAIIDNVGPSRHLLSIVGVLPWLYLQATNEHHRQTALQFCSRLALAIDESHCQWQFAEVADCLRQYGSEDERDTIIGSICRHLCESCFPRDAVACSSLLLRLLKGGHIKIRSSTLQVAGFLVEKSSSFGSTSLSVFDDLLSYASTLIAQSDGLELEAVTNLFTVCCNAVSKTSPDPSVCMPSPSVGDKTNSFLEGESAPLHEQPAQLNDYDSYKSAASALACFSGDSTGFFSKSCEIGSVALTQSGGGLTPLPVTPQSRRSSTVVSSAISRAANVPANPATHRGSITPLTPSSAQTPASESRQAVRRRSSSSTSILSQAAPKIVPVTCTLSNLIDTPQLSEHFRQFVATHGDVRGLEFYTIVSKNFLTLPAAPTGDLLRKKEAKAIFARFIDAEAAECLDIDDATRKEISEQLATPPPLQIFNRVMQTVKNDLVTSYTAFCDSLEYETLVRSGHLISP
uniref:RGS domain-containing protein n=1 Tax=Spongospora subterranea TaxID=70186 RepID=A0A0H5RP05_9EUKA|eukprot:CRZ10444.1 hypothetical protein [Spongospora subterranea]